MKTLSLSKEVQPPHETVTQKLAFLGTTGSGKTYGASKLAELFWDIGAQFVVLDPVGVWYGLRLAKDGKKPSHINIPIFGGLHGDVPLESTAGELLANLIVDKGLSCIIDVSQFESDAEKARFATDFANRFFFRKKAAPSAVHLFLEECQEFVPQNPQRGEEKMLHAFVRMQKLGRNFGIGSSYITQRPQEVNKKALNMAQTLFVFRNTGTHERAAIEKWIEDKSLDESIAQDLPKLATGTCHVWSPEFLKISETAHINEKETFNASATPEIGKVAKTRELAPIDLDQVRTEMAATIEKAKNDDPKLLRHRILILEKELTKKSGGQADPKETERAVKKALLEREREYDKERSEMIKQTRNFLKAIQTIGEVVAPLLKEKIEMTAPPLQVYIPGKPFVEPRKEIGKALVDTNIQYASDEITGPEQKVLDALAWMKSIGTTAPQRSVIAFLAGYTNTRSTGFTNPCGSLRSKGLVGYPSSDTISLTSNGEKAAHCPEVPLDTDTLHREILARLPGPEQKLLKELLKIYPGAVDNSSLASAAGYSNERSTGYTNPRGRLRSFGFVEYHSGGLVRASDMLFIS